MEDGRKGMENALKANPQDVLEQYERQLKELQEAYDEVMLELRARKNCSPCWARTRSDRDDPPRTAGRRHHRLDLQAVPLVWCSQAHGVLPPGQSCAEGAGTLRGTDQGHDRGEPVVWVSDRGASAGVQQEHGAAHLPDQRLAGAQAPGRLQAQDPIPALGGQGAQRALGHRHVPGLGRP